MCACSHSAVHNVACLTGQKTFHPSSTAPFFSRISSNNHNIEPFTTKRNKLPLFCQTSESESEREREGEGERELHLEKSVGNGSWRFELSPRRTKMLCSQAVCWEGCVGGSEVAKLLLF